MRNLKDFQSVYGSLKDLNFLASPYLRTLTLAYCRTIEELDGVWYPEGLTEIDIENCSRLYVSPDFLSRLKNLQRFTSGKFKGLESVKALSELSELEIFTFLNTPVHDKDISAFLQAKKLCHVWGKSDPAFTPPLKDVIAHFRSAT